MVGHAGSPARTLYIDVTLTWSKVKVTGLLNFWQLAEAVHAGGDDRRPLEGLSGFDSGIWRISECVMDFPPIRNLCMSMKDEVSGWFFLFGVSALSSLQRYDVVILLTGMMSGLNKTIWRTSVGFFSGPISFGQNTRKQGQSKQNCCK